MELLPDGLKPFIVRRLQNALGKGWPQEVLSRFPAWRVERTGGFNLDTQKLLQIMERLWNDGFRDVLSRTHRSIVNELMEVRNRLAHNEAFSYDDAERALDSMRRLLEAISAGESAGKVGKMRDAILREKYQEQARWEARKKQPSILPAGAAVGLMSWREVVEPHRDVATGDFQQAEFAADLAKVHEGTAPPEYNDAQEFFSRTYLTDGLKRLLEGAAARLSGQGGDPVIELHTNFGGGKTHAMLALYHMAGRAPVSELPGLDQLLVDRDLSVPDRINRAVFVGTARGPLDVVRTGQGQDIRTIWGDMAWQLGGSAAFDRIAENDARGIAPGSNVLGDIFRTCAPCLILIDEWVAYLRQIYRDEGLPSGSFDTNLTFVQSLTEAVKAAPQTLLVATLPASQIEVGGEGGQAALDRLKQTFSRVESSWRPASREESYGIVRRRLFKAMPGDRYRHRDNTVKQFARLYRDHPEDFPRECTEADYRGRLENAYPIHPDLFDHLDTMWGALDTFQRTRGVLRLMAQVIHELWMSGDPSAMIMPGSVDISSERVGPELRRYLPNAWQGIIAGDVDGEHSIPCGIDREITNLGRHAVARRVARAIFMATAPGEGQNNPGIDHRQVNLGVAQPGESVGNFDDALRRLSGKARFMHSDHERYFYSTSPNLNRMAADRADRLEEELVRAEMDRSLKDLINRSVRADRGQFDAVQVAPGDSGDVPDEADGVRLIVLGASHPHASRGDSRARDEAGDILLHRGTAPRVYRNTLVFLAADKLFLKEMMAAARLYLAWDGIQRDADTGRLDLKRSQIVSVKENVKKLRETIDTQIHTVWCHFMRPYQEAPEADVQWSSSRLQPPDRPVGFVSKRLVSEEGLVPEIGPGRLDRDLREYIWKDKPHLRLKDVWEYLNRYIYLPRLKNREVLISCVRSSISGIVPGPFAYAERWNEENESYDGLAIENSMNATVSIDSDSVIVGPDVAAANRPEPPPTISEEGTVAVGTSAGGASPAEPPPKPEVWPKRFTGTVMLPVDRPVHHMAKITEFIVEELANLPKVELTLRLEIDAEIPSGLDPAKVRTLLENTRTLGFIDKSLK